MPEATAAAMNRNQKLADQIKEWARKHLAEAEEDEYLTLLSARQAEGYETDLAWGRQFVRDTVELVRWAAAGLTLERPSSEIERFLTRQVYDLRAARARYLLTFQSGALPQARLLVDAIRQVDLTGLFDALGFRHLMIARRDGSPMSKAEAKRLETAVAEDFGADTRAADEEIHLVFDRDDIQLHVMPREAAGNV